MSSGGSTRVLTNFIEDTRSLRMPINPTTVDATARDSAFRRSAGV